MNSKLVYVTICLLAIASLACADEYLNQDEPPCKDDCFAKASTNVVEKDECLKTYMEFYSYKLVKSMFNYAKSCVYAGLWSKRYEYADDDLFGAVFNQTLSKYNNSEILGSMSFQELDETARYLYNQLKYLTKKEGVAKLKYESYPSLACPTPCSYELVTWQTMFYLALIIFVLALISVLFYSAFLRKQYLVLRARTRDSSYAKVDS